MKKSQSFFVIPSLGHLISLSNRWRYNSGQILFGELIDFNKLMPNPTRSKKYLCFAQNETNDTHTISFLPNSIQSYIPSYTMQSLLFWKIYWIFMPFISPNHRLNNTTLFFHPSQNSYCSRKNWNSIICVGFYAISSSSTSSSSSSGKQSFLFFSPLPLSTPGFHCHIHYPYWFRWFQYLWILNHWIVRSWLFKASPSICEEEGADEYYSLCVNLH